MIDKLISLIRASEWHEVERILLDYWCEQCPLICAPIEDPSVDFKINDKKLNHKLLHPIACAYCLDKNVGIDLKSLNELYGSKTGTNRKSAFCGHVFRNGEPTYSCKECACDSTCVLCYQCFLNSAHKSHKYRMATSAGNGYCDCGDVEAWKEHPACELHTIQEDEQQDMEVVDDVSEEVNSRVRSLTRTMLHFSIRMICWHDENELPAFLKGKEMDASLPPYQTILLNDETHTYDSVIRALNLSIHCDETEAMQMATIIDREGRACVRSGNYEYCKKAKEEIQRRTQRDSNQRTEKSGPLDVLVLDSRLVSLQNFALRLITWLIAQTRHFPALAFIVGDTLLTEKLLVITDNGREEKVDETLILHIMKRDRALWKGARITFHQMIMSTVLMNNEQKLNFSRLFVRLYKQILDDFIDDDHDHSVSIAALTVQIFTVPTIARMLIAEESALQVICDALIDQCKKYLKIPRKLKFDFSARSFPHAVRRAMYMICDLRYLLSVIPSQQDWTATLCVNFLNGCYSIIRFLSCMQNMDEVRRLTAEHQVWEQEWETAFNIQIKMQHVLTLIICWANSDKFVHNRLMNHLLNEIEVIAHRSAEFSKRIAVEVNGITAMCIPFDVSQGAVSVHQPLWRLLAGLFAAPQSILQGVGISEQTETFAFEMINLKGKRAVLMEMPLRVFVLCSQSQAQMWRRNGFSLVNQLHNYSAPICRTEMFDRDILMLQVCAALMPPDVYIIRVLHRFGLWQWAESNFEEIRAAGFGHVASEDLSKCTVTVAEEMLQLFIIVIGERYFPGVGKSTAEGLLRREVLHILATKPKQFSKIERAIPDNCFFGKLSLEEITKSVADFRQPIKSAPGYFSLKDSVRDEYNAFFYHYTKTDVSNADQYRQKATNIPLKKEVAVAAPPMPPPFEPFFQPIVNLLTAKTMMQLIRVVLDRTARRSRFSSEGLLHRALFLVGMGLNEQIRNKDFDFIGCAEGADIFSMMRNLVGKPEAEPHGNLLNYMLKLYEKTKPKSEGTAETAEPKAEAVSEHEMKAKKAAVAAKKRKQAMEQMRRLQKQFVTQNQELLEDSDEGEVHHKHDDDDEPMGILPEGSGYPVCLGINRSAAKCSTNRRITCILCQEDQDVTTSGQAVVCVAYMGNSSLFARLKFDEDESYLSEVFVPASLRNGASSSTCGHMMHFDCYKKFTDSMKDRERGRAHQPMAYNPRVVDVTRGEYLCPLCKRLSNTVLPVLPPLTHPVAERSENEEKHIEFEDWISYWSGFVNRIENDSLGPKMNKPFKSHSRKRSHSERSLTEIADREVEMETALSASVPSSSAVSLMETETAGHESPKMMETDEGSEKTVVEKGGADGRFLAIFSSIPEVMHKIKELLIQPERQQQFVRTHFSLSIWDMVYHFLLHTYKNFQNDRLASHLSQEVMAAVLTFQTTAFSLRSIAMVLRRGGKPLFGAWNARQRECIYSLSRSCAAATVKCHSTYHLLRFLLMQLLTPLLLDKRSATEQSDTASSAYATGSRQANSPDELLMLVQIAQDLKQPVNILSIDMLSLAFEMALCEGWKRTIKNSKGQPHIIFPRGSENEQYAIRLALIGHLYQVFATFDAEAIVSEKPTTPLAPLEDKSLDDLLLRLYTIARPGEVLSSILALKETLHTAVLEFLRPISLLYHALTLVPPPEALKDPSVHEFEPLCRYLGFTPSITEFLDGPHIEKLFTLWTSAQRNSQTMKYVRQPVLENALVRLPDDFSELIHNSAQYRCPSAAADEHLSSIPNLCLVCGALLCSQTYCCQRTVNGVTLGTCSYHLKNCTGDSGGLFLRIRDSQVLLLTTRERGCLQAAPYVDEYGETDPGFRRGYPMHLNKELYAKLENLWLNQGITEEVVNQAEIDHRNMGFEWQHF